MVLMSALSTIHLSVNDSVKIIINFITIATYFIKIKNKKQEMEYFCFLTQNVPFFKSP